MEKINEYLITCKSFRGFSLRCLDTLIVKKTRWQSCDAVAFIDDFVVLCLESERVFCHFLDVPDSSVELSVTSASRLIHTMAFM